MPIRDQIRPAVVEVVRRLAEAHFECYIVGGAVRDLLLGIEPKDYDLATSATPKEVRKVFGRRRCRIIGRRFRLAHVYGGDDVYEVSTFRRKPSAEERCQRGDDDGVMIWNDNQYGTLEQDATRRDFTVNALYYDPVGDRGLIDMVDGEADLNRRLVRAIGDPGVRIEEDPVRVLRALKLVGQFGFALEDALAGEVRTRGEKIRLASANRLFEELLKIIAHPRALHVLEAFHDHDFLASYWPGMARNWTSPIGRCARGLLAERGKRLAGSSYPPSKALALATIAFAGVSAELGGGDPLDLWEHRGGLEHPCRRAVREAFHPFPVSRYFTARVRDILLLLPRMVDAGRKKRVMRHSEYKYGRELLSLLACVSSRFSDILEQWPEPDPADSDHARHRPRSAGSRGRKRSRRRRRRTR